LKNDETLRDLLSATEHMLDALDHLKVYPQPLRVTEALAAARDLLAQCRRKQADELCRELEAEERARAKLPSRSAGLALAAVGLEP
jgi:hypothetical protein